MWQIPKLRKEKGRAIIPTASVTVSFFGFRVYYFQTIPPIPPQAHVEIIRRREYEDRKRVFTALKEQAKTSAQSNFSAPEGERSACQEEEKPRRSTVCEERLQEGELKQREVEEQGKLDGERRNQEIEDRKRRDEQREHRNEKRKQQDKVRRQREEGRSEGNEERRQRVEDESQRNNSVEEVLTSIEEPRCIVKQCSLTIGGADLAVVHGGEESRRELPRWETRRGRRNGGGRAFIKDKPRSVRRPTRRSDPAIVGQSNRRDDVAAALLLCLCIGVVLGILFMLMVAGPSAMKI
ncbi:MAG: hypothetical protein Q9209_003756 [Squamulea sp. 1 TL-2023]